VIWNTRCSAGRSDPTASKGSSTDWPRTGGAWPALSNPSAGGDGHLRGRSCWGARERDVRQDRFFGRFPAAPRPHMRAGCVRNQPSRALSKIAEPPRRPVALARPGRRNRPDRHAARGARAATHSLRRRLDHRERQPCPGPVLPESGQASTQGGWPVTPTASGRRAG
jgi:hypothetical protein